MSVGNDVISYYYQYYFFDIIRSSRCLGDDGDRYHNQIRESNLATRGPCVSDSPYIIFSRQSAAKWILELGIFKLEGRWSVRVETRRPHQIQYCHFHINELLACEYNGGRLLGAIIPNAFI